MKLRKRKTTREQKFNLKFLSVFSRASAQFEPVISGFSYTVQIYKIQPQKKKQVGPGWSESYSGVIWGSLCLPD